MFSSRLCGRLFAGISVLLLVLVQMLLFSYGGYAQTAPVRVTLKPAAVLSWDDLLRIDAQRPRDQVHPIHEPQPGPAPRGIPQGGVSGSNSLQLPSPTRGGLPETAQSEASLQSAPASKSFNALLDNNTVIPPDTHGSVGPSHLMTMLNSEVKIQNKNGDSLSQMSLASFWSKLPGTNSFFDPRVHYDAIHGRWLAVVDDNAFSQTNSSLGFAISSTSDPTGTWTFYKIKADSPVSTGAWADYPSMGFSNKWIAIAVNMFDSVSGSFTGVKLWAIDQTSALGGGALTFSVFPVGFDNAGGISGFTLQPCVTMGSTDTLYIVDNSGYYATSDTTMLLRISQITGTGTSPAWSVLPGSSFSGSGAFRVANNFNTNQINAAQLGTSTLISTNDNRMMNAVVRNGKIWCAHSGGLPPKVAPTPDRTAAFWYQLTPVLPSPIVQSGVLDGGSNVHHYFPSISANKNNDACLGFTRSDPTMYAQAVFTGRLSTDAAGAMQTIQVFETGISSYSKFYSGSRNRWGDYSNTCVDPSDDVTFWIIQEYAGQNVGSGMNDGEWATRWGEVIPSVSLPIQLAYFNAASTPDGHVLLTWQTVSETNNYGFEIEKSPSGPNSYQMIPNSFVPGHGTTIVPHQYSYSDPAGTGGSWWYRLKQIDLDGSVHYSDGVQLDILAGVPGATQPVRTSLSQNFPNPFNPSTMISFTLAKPGMVTLTVYNMLGEEVTTLLKTEKEAGEHRVMWSPANLPSGSYIYRLQANGYVENRKLMLLK